MNTMEIYIKIEPLEYAAYGNGWYVDGSIDGDLYTAYRLDCETDREEFSRLSAMYIDCEF